MKARHRIAFSLAIGIATFIVFLFHPYFRVNSIHVNDTHFLAREDVEQGLRPILHKNILVRYFLGPFMRRFQDANPAILGMTVSIDFPDHLSVVIQEKTAWVAFFSEGRTIFVAKDGSILNPDRTVAFPDQDLIPIVRGVPLNVLQNDTIPFWLHDNITLLISNISTYFPNQNLQIELLHHMQFMVLKDDILPIKIGSLDFLDHKFRNLRAFLDNYQENMPPIAYIDLRIEDRIVVQYDKS